MDQRAGACVERGEKKMDSRGGNEKLEKNSRKQVRVGPLPGWENYLSRDRFHEVTAFNLVWCGSITTSP